MALGVKKRGEIETRININNKARRDAAKAIEEHGEKVTDKNIDRYLLWEQQMHNCPYCNRRIELGEALGSETEREHILPRTLTRVGGKRSQLVLAHRGCNQEKGNRTPWQAFGSDETRWRLIEEHAGQLARNRQWGKAKLLLLKDWEDEVLDNEAIKGFTDRQFHESSWIAKLTAQWLRGVCRDVCVSRGELTAHLRRIWKLDTVIPQVRHESGLPVLDRDGKQISKDEFELHKTWWEGHNERAGGVPTEHKPDKRIDHRHHLIDALVISLTDRELFRKMAENYKRERERERQGERARLNLYEIPPILDLRDQAVKLITHAVIRHKPDRHPDGPLFDQTAYGISRKVGRDGKRKLALRKPLKALIDNKGNIEKTRRILESIESEVTRNTVLQAFDQQIADGIDIKQAFDKPIIHPGFDTQIKHVRLLGNSENTAATIEHHNRNGKRLEKRYPHAGNAFLEIRVQDGKLACAPHVAFVQEAMNKRNAKAGNGIRRFWKGDTVRLADGSLHLVGIIAIQGGGQLRLVPVTETCTFGELKKRGLTMRTVSGDALAGVEIVDV
jgi:CRISPR-associated endonuclease Csn1